MLEETGNEPNLSKKQDQCSSVYFLVEYLIFWVRLNDVEVVIAGNTLRLPSNKVQISTVPSATTVNNAVQFLRKDEENVAALPYMAGLYFLSGKDSVTRYNKLSAHSSNKLSQHECMG